MKNNLYKLDNNVERLINGKPTLFLEPHEFKNIKHKIKDINYNIYQVYDDCDKVILYKNALPKIVLYKIESDSIITHQSVLGTIFHLGIDISYIGDIVKYEDNFYIYLFKDMEKYLCDNLTHISNNKIKLIKCNINYLSNYEREYEEINLIVSSTRIDVIISSLCNISRKEVLNKFDLKEIYLNNVIPEKNTYDLKVGDTFSIRRFGKYKFNGITNNTKKNKLIVNILKYI